LSIFPNNVGLCLASSRNVVLWGSNKRRMAESLWQYLLQPSFVLPHDCCCLYYMLQSSLAPLWSNSRFWGKHLHVLVSYMEVYLQRCIKHCICCYGS